MLAERVYRRMRSDLLRGRIRPGERVVEQWAAEHYQASRTPVREACRRLAEEGLLVHRPQRGYMAPVIEQAELDELYELRRAIEVLSVRTACGAADRGRRLQALRAQWSGPIPETGEEIVYNDEAFHLGIAETGGNRQVQGALAGINARIRLVRVHDFLDAARVRATVRQHVQILDAVEDGDAEKAGALMIVHIIESQRAVVAAAARAQEAFAAG
ncbi:MAG: GntR family transcriptional regulator [Thermoleophilia bacterium]